MPRARVPGIPARSAYVAAALGFVPPPGGAPRRAPPPGGWTPAAGRRARPRIACAGAASGGGAALRAAARGATRAGPAVLGERDPAAVSPHGSGALPSAAAMPRRARRPPARPVEVAVVEREASPLPRRPPVGVARPLGASHPSVGLADHRQRGVEETGAADIRLGARVASPGRVVDARCDRIGGGRGSDGRDAGAGLGHGTSARVALMVRDRWAMAARRRRHHTCRGARAAGSPRAHRRSTGGGPWPRRRCASC